MWSLAKKYGTTVDVLASWNDITDVTFIKVGQKQYVENPDTYSSPDPIEYKPAEIDFSKLKMSTRIPELSPNGILNTDTGLTFRLRNFISVGVSSPIAGHGL